ncbi:hypothetical protein BV898_04711 [Hypsibius exemplaris]|uniref:Uncharacterized protein n=1 Tax=Hypsibius exemplaris TaxID=2072580 RepID=A0A1W0X183_HYPEX|nr:hypothetical protein BV898_04711 [Hypsibius exemplaris]
MGKRRNVMYHSETSRDGRRRRQATDRRNAGRGTTRERPMGRVPKNPQIINLIVSLKIEWRTVSVLVTSASYIVAGKSFYSCWHLPAASYSKEVAAADHVHPSRSSST